MHLTRDLSGDLAFTFALLSRPFDWRQRQVERLELGTSELLTMSTTYQVYLTEDFVAPFVRPHASSVTCLLPLVQRPKQPLIGVDFIGPNGAPARLLLKNEIAAVQECLLTHLADVAGLKRVEVARDLFLAISSFSPAFFREVSSVERNPTRALASYLSQGLGFSVSTAEAAALHMVARRSGDDLAALLGEPPSPFSASDNVLLALPYMDAPPSSCAEIERIVGRYASIVDQAIAVEATDFLVRLAQYGRRWEMLVHTQVPVGVPTTVRMTDKRTWDLERRRRSRPWQLWVEQEVHTKGAPSFHFEARVLDHTIEVDTFDVRDITDEIVGVPNLDSARHTSQSVSLYASDLDRPTVITVAMRLRAMKRVRYTSYSLLLLTLAALFGATRVGNPDLPDKLAMLAIPIGLASALLTLRDESLAARHLQWRARALLGTGLVALWGICLVRLDPAISASLSRAIEPTFQRVSGTLSTGASSVLTWVRSMS